MQKYDLCLIGSDGRIDYIVPLRAADDETAITEAERQASHRSMELWAGSQLVWRHPPMVPCVWGVAGTPRSKGLGET